MAAQLDSAQKRHDGPFADAIRREQLVQCIHDNGETWDIQTEVAIRNDFPNWDVGYPESLQMPDGRVLTVYYYNLFNKYYIGGTTWTP